MARTCGRGRLAQCAAPDPGLRGSGRATLDSGRAPAMGGPMASPMMPPADAPSFLATCGWAGARIEPLAGDASFRRYFRVIGEGRSAVLMDAPPPHEDPRPFVAVAEWLGSTGLSAPEIIARDLDQWLEELKLFTDWYCPALGLTVNVEAYRAAWTEVLEPVASDGLGPVTILRDYHAENVMLVRGREGITHFGLLDFQDALAGHPAYDLASVLEDARRDVPEEVERAMIDRYISATGHGAAFERGYWCLAAQRNTRILGVFPRL